MTTLRHDTTTGLRHDSDIDSDTSVTDTLVRQHTIASITLEAGSSKRTVHRWLNKCGDIGILKDGTRYFSDVEKAQILLHQSKPKQTEEVVEAELIEPGAIQLHQADSTTAAPLMRFDLKPIELDLPTADNSALATQAEQFEQSAQQGANAIAAYFGARFDVGLANIAAKQDNLLKGIEAAALNGAARSVSSAQQKPGDRA